MGLRKSILMLSNTGNKRDVVGEPIRADAYYGYTDGLHSVQVIYQNFIGGFGIQGTLAFNPSPEDWFWMNLKGPTCNNYPYLIYPQNPLHPTGCDGGDTGTELFTFIGNFVFLRAVITREYIINPRTEFLGQVDKVWLSL